MLILTILAYLLCVFDYICTRHWIKRFGVEIEANHIGQWLFNAGSGALAFFVKVVLSFGLLAFLYQFRDVPLGKAGIWIIFLAYLAVAVYHIIILIKVNNL